VLLKDNEKLYFGIIDELCSFILLLSNKILYKNSEGGRGKDV